MHNAHAATTAAASGLDDHRVTHFATNAQSGFFVFRQRAVRTRNGRYASCDHGVLGRYLVAHQANGFGFRANEREAGFLDLFGEVGVFRKEAVARVNGGGASHFGCGNDCRNVQVGVGGRCRTDADGFVCQAQVHQFLVSLGVNGDGLDAHLFAGAQDPQGDLTAVGDQNFFQLRSHQRLSAVQTMVNSGWSYSTGWPSSTRMDSITPLVSASMWFIIFMASTMHRVSPFFTVWPTSTKDGEDGEDWR
ncbi:hypothetical protein D9M73_145880 [compost metagenome]